MQDRLTVPALWAAFPGLTGFSARRAEPGSDTSESDPALDLSLDRYQKVRQNSPDRVPIKPMRNRRLQTLSRRNSGITGVSSNHSSREADRQGFTQTKRSGPAPWDSLTSRLTQARRGEIKRASSGLPIEGDPSAALHKTVYRSDPGVPAGPGSRLTSLRLVPTCCPVLRRTSGALDSI
jgi:hypothetical protein